MTPKQQRIFGDVCIILGLPLILLIGGLLTMLDWKIGSK